MESAKPAGKGTLPPTDFVDLEIGTRTGRPPGLNWDIKITTPDRRTEEECLAVTIYTRKVMHILTVATLGVYVASAFGVYRYSTLKRVGEFGLIFAPFYLLLVAMIQYCGNEANKVVEEINEADAIRSKNIRDHLDKTLLNIHK
ncbi:uncharacterized protein LOC107305100 [Oryza brachyantha]|uniref:Uncharacterized protein n=1 Tax=Oryza brachyantha TaxID=4533 RepID=J3L4L3_ORYBR|nr:uncharacterized protein LOC107305100 [Oryza brachyantha]